MPAKAHCASRIAKKIFARRASQAKSPAQPTTSNVRHATPTTSARNAERAIHCPVAANAPATTTTTAPTGAPSAMKAVASASTASATPTATEPTSASSASASIVGSVARYPFLEGLEQTLPLEMGISRGPLPPPLRGAQCCCALSLSRAVPGNGTFTLLSSLVANATTQRLCSYSANAPVLLLGRWPSNPTRQRTALTRSDPSGAGAPRGAASVRARHGARRGRSGRGPLKISFSGGGSAPDPPKTKTNCRPRLAHQ